MKGDLKLKPRLLMIGGLAAILGGAALTAVPAVAQDYDYDRYGTVTGEVIVRGMPERDPATGADIDTVTATRVVYTRDLDLNTAWGQRTLRHRIQRAASEACDYLNDRYVTIDSNSPDCYRRAVRDGMEQAEAMVGHPLYAYNY